MPITDAEYQEWLTTVREHLLVQHALANDCTDPDCELHHPDVALSEMVIDHGNVSFWIAGAMHLVDLINDSDSDDEAIEKFLTEVKGMLNS